MTFQLSTRNATTETRTPEQSGVAMVLVVTVLAALLAGGAVILSLQLGGTRKAALVKGRKAAMYCAEAGLVAARAPVRGSQGIWGDLLDDWNPTTQQLRSTGPETTNNPPWYVAGVGIAGDIDVPPDGVNDYQVTVRDDADDADFATDANRRVYIVSRCTKYPDTPGEILELIDVSASTFAYGDQAGQGAGNTGNTNQAP